MAEQGSGDGEREALYAVAMLRIALELKKSPAPSLDELINATAARMRLEAPDLRAYLSRHLGLVGAGAPARRRLKPV